MGTDDPSKLGLAEKSKNLASLLAELLFCPPHSHSECTLAHFFVSVFIRVISGFIIIISCNMM
jgi:hypothetical protein